MHFSSNRKSIREVVVSALFRELLFASDFPIYFFFSNLNPEFP
jgi:hypothetical protein